MQQIRKLAGLLQQKTCSAAHNEIIEAANSLSGLLLGAWLTR
jgi:hypothetical protein